MRWLLEVVYDHRWCIQQLAIDLQHARECQELSSSFRPHRPYIVCWLQHSSQSSIFSVKHQ